MSVEPPELDDVEAAALSSPLLAAITRLRTWLGPTGTALTAAGGLRFEDSRSAAELLGVPLHDELDGSSDGPFGPDLRPRFDLLVTIAEECGAVRLDRRRMVPVASWDHEEPIVQASIALSTLIEVGPMYTSNIAGCDETLLLLRDTVLDALVIQWLITLLPTDRVQTVDHFVNWAVDACREQLGGDPCTNEGGLEPWVDNGVAYLMDALAWAGAITWSERVLRRVTLDVTARWIGGGVVRITPLGRHVLPDHLASAGFTLRAVEDRGPHASAASLLGDVQVTAGDGERRALVEAWRPDLDDAERAGLVVGAMLDTSWTPARLAGFEALGVIGAEAAAPVVRQLLDSPCAEGAAHFLVSRGLAHKDDLRPFLGLGPLIDRLATVSGQPHLLRQAVTHLLEQVEAPQLLLEVIASDLRDEATLVLVAAARHVTDPRFASMLREAERLHHELRFHADPAA